MGSYYTEGHQVWKDIGDPEQHLVGLAASDQDAFDIAAALNGIEIQEMEEDRLAGEPLYDTLLHEVGCHLKKLDNDGYWLPAENLLKALPVKTLIEFLPDASQDKFKTLRPGYQEPVMFSGQCEHGIAIGRSCPDCKRIQL